VSSQKSTYATTARSPFDRGVVATPNERQQQQQQQQLSLPTLSDANTHTSRSTHANNTQVRQQFNPHTSLFFMIHGVLDINLEGSSEEKSVARPPLSTRDGCQSHTATSLPFRNLPAPLPRDIHHRQRTRCPLALLVQNLPLGPPTHTQNMLSFDS
jgi:hypothetical protein